MTINKIVFAIFLACGLTIQSGAQQSFNFQHDGISREYILYIPEDLPKHAPLVLALHGYSGNAERMMNKCGMNEVADVNKFVVCYPQGTKDRIDITHWNARLGISSTDDIGFLSELAKFLQNEYELDSKRTFSCGHSNGGFMSYALACEAPDIFKAIASMAGTMSGYTWSNRNSSSPISILQIHGLDDDVVPITGISVPGWAGAPHMDEVIAYWVERNDCSTSDSTLFPDNTKAYYYSEGIDQNQVWYYKIDNWGHNWPEEKDVEHTGIIASEVIWDFFNTVGSRIVGIEESSLPIVKIYPNPTTNQIHIMTQELQGEKYTLFSLSGKPVLEGKLNADVITLEMSTQAVGIYILKIGKQRYKLIKQ